MQKAIRKRRKLTARMIPAEVIAVAAAAAEVAVAAVAEVDAAGAGPDLKKMIR